MVWFASTRPAALATGPRHPEGNQKQNPPRLSARRATSPRSITANDWPREGDNSLGACTVWKRMIQLELTGPARHCLGFPGRIHGSHSALYPRVHAPEDRLLPEKWNWDQPAVLDDALARLTAALRPWTIDFHIAQNDATVKGSGTHDKTGRHCLPNDPQGKLNIAHHAGFWMRDSYKNPTRKFNHVCWDGCMFPNEVMMKPQTWNSILAAMVAVRDAHGWKE